MLFNSLEYFLFLVVVLIFYYSITASKRWVLLLTASYLFYMNWQAEYAMLLAISTWVDYVVGLKMSALQSKQQRRPWLYLSLAVNLGFLISFKYLNFLADHLNFIFGNFGLPFHAALPDLLLPIGISFYTFQSLSYSIDVYRGEREAETHLGIFALYVSFFPQLVSGPIERSSALIPQFYEKHPFLFENLSNGGKLILWGLFQKMVVGDNLGIYVNEIFSHPDSYQGAPVLLGVYFFAMQVYCDFAGYTNIAIGSATLFGIRLSENFRRPYLSRSIQEFWSRWHITLTNWMRDYLYISLGGNRRGYLRQQLNLYLVFLAVAIWHGTDAKLVLFGTLHYSYYLLQTLGKTPALRLLAYFSLEKKPLFRKFIPIFITFHLVAFTWVIWWATSLDDALMIIQRSFWLEHYNWDRVNILSDLALLPMCIISLLILEFVYILQGKHTEINFLAHKNRALRWGILYLLLFGLLFLTPAQESNAFIYFQF